MTNGTERERALREFFDGNEVLKTLAETQQLHTQMLQTLLKAISPPADNDARLVEAIERLHAAVSQQTEPRRDWRRPFLLRRRSDEQSCEEVFP